MLTFEFLKLEQNYIPLLKALMCGFNALVAQGLRAKTLKSRFLCIHTSKKNLHRKMGSLVRKLAILEFWAFQ